MKKIIFLSAVLFMTASIYAQTDTTKKRPVKDTTKKKDSVMFSGSYVPGRVTAAHSGLALVVTVHDLIATAVDAQEYRSKACLWKQEEII